MNGSIILILILYKKAAVLPPVPAVSNALLLYPLNQPAESLAYSLAENLP